MNANRVLKPLLVVGVIFALVSTAVGLYLFSKAEDPKSAETEVIVVDLQDANDDRSTTDKQIVGGDLKVTGGLEAADSVSSARLNLTPSTGASLSAGQLYLDEHYGLHYYNGKSDININVMSSDISDLKVAVAEQASRIPSDIDVGVLSLQGQSGNVALGAGGGIGISGTTITNTGVTSFGGQTGSIGIGSGLAVSGGMLINTRSSGIQSIISGSSNIIVTDSGGGNLTISQTGSGAGGTVALGPVAAQVDPSDNSSLWINKTGSGNLVQMSTGASAVNRFVVDQSGAILTGTISFDQITGLPSFVNSIGGGTGSITLGTGLARSGQTLTNTGVTSLAGLSGAVGIGSGLSVVDGSLVATQSGIGSITGTPGQIIVSGDTSITLSLPQDIDVTSTPTFAGVNLLTPLSIASGGTGSSTAEGARNNIGAAARGANSDITSLQGLTTAISVSQGGTGVGSFTQNGVLVGQGSGPLASVTASEDGQCLVSTADGPVFQSCPGSGTISTITGTPNQIEVVGTDNITLSLPQDIAVTSTPTFAGLTLSSALSVSNGGTGANNSASARNNLGAAASGINSDISQLTGLSNIASAGSLTIDALNNNLTLQGANTTLSSYGSGFATNLTFAAPAANVTYRLQTAAAGTYDVCTTAGNCVGVGGGVTTIGGTIGSLAKFSASGSIVDSLISDDGSEVSVAGVLNVDTLSTILGGHNILVPNASGTLAVSASGNIALSPTGNISFVGLLPVSNGGTGASSAIDARINLGVAARGANTDITSLLGLTTALSVSQGGTGAANLTQNGVVIGQGTSGLMAVTSSDAGQCLVSTSSGAPVFQSCPGAGGVAGISGTPNQVIVSGSGNLTLSLPQDIAVSSSPTFAGLTLSSALSVSSGGTGASTAAGARSNIGAAASGANSDITSLSGLSNVNSAGPLAVASTGNLTLQGANTTLSASTGGFASSLTFAAPAANVTYRLQTAAAGTYDVCTTAGNCVGVGGGVTTPGGTANRIAKFSSSGAIVDSLLSDDGAAVSVGGVLRVDSISTLSGDNTILVPNGSGTIAISASGPITLDANGNLDCASCLTSGGSGGTSGVGSVNGMSGALTINSVSGSSIVNAGTTITIQDASDVIKGLAAFNPDNLTVSSGVVNTVQDISVSSAPTFAGLNVTSSNGLTIGSTGNAGGILFDDGSSIFRAGLVAGQYSANRSIVIPNASGTMAVSASGNIALSPTGNISFTGLLPVANGGTGSSTAGGALTNLGAAARGANSDITSLLGLTTALSVAQGGTGTSNLAQNGVLVGQGTSGINSVVAGTAGQCLMSTSGAPVWQDCPGGGGVDSLNGIAGSLTLAGASIGSVSTSGDTITIHDASHTTKGLASFSAANFTVNDGRVDTIQGISTSSSPTFNALNLSTALGLASGGTGVSSTPNIGQLLIGNGTGYSLSTLTAGAGIAINNAAGAITISAPTSGTCALCANQSLSNLSNVAINSNLLPGVSDAVDLGSSALAFRDGHFSGTLRSNVLDAASAGVLAIGSSNATAINLNQDTVLAANKTLTITGGNTAGRPVAPTEGTIYFDTTTKQLLTYADGKWKGDKSGTALIVAASNSPQALKDAADYLVNGDTAAANDGDQVEINAALTAAAGGTVYLAQGTYVVDATILVPNNTTLAGAGSNTLIEFAAINASDSMIEVTGSALSGQAIQNMRLDGRKDLNTVGAIRGINFTGIGTAPSRQGAKVSNVEVGNFTSYGIFHTNSSGSSFTNVSSNGNNSDGFRLSVTDSSFTGLEANNNTGNGIYVSNSSNTVFENATTNNNTGMGLELFSGSGPINVRDSFSTGNTGNGYHSRTPNAKFVNVRATQNGSRGIFTDNDNEVNGSSFINNIGYGIEVAGANTIVHDNLISGNSDGINFGYSGAGQITNNIIRNNLGDGIEKNRIVSSGTQTYSGNQIFSNGGYGIYTSGYASERLVQTITDNEVNSNTLGGISVGNLYDSVVSNNRISNNGGATTNNGIIASGRNHNNTFIGNNITDTSCTSSCIAFSIGGSNNYLSGNRLGGGALVDTGTDNVYANQESVTGDLINKGPGAFTVNTSTVTSSLSLQGGMTNSKLPSPGQPTLTRTGASGTTYGYRITALDGTGETLPSAERTVSAASTLDTTSFITISWSSVPGAVSYNIYRTTAGGIPSSTGLIGNIKNTNLSTISFVDNGLVATTAAPAANTTGGASIAGSLQAGSDASIAGALLAGGSLTAGTTLYSEKLTDPDVLPTGNSQKASYSPDGQYMSVTHSTAPFISIYKRSGDSYSKLPNPSVLPAGNGRDVAWSPDGQYMSITHSAAPFVTVYKQQGDVFTKLDVEGPSAYLVGYGVAWSPDGQYMSVSHGGTPYVTNYKRTGDTFTKLPSLPVQAPGNPKVTYSPDGQHLVVAGGGISVYKQSGDDFVKLADPPDSNSWAIGSATGISYSPSGTYMSVAHHNYPYISIYKRSGDTYTKLATPDGVPANQAGTFATDTAWTPDGNNVMLTFSASPRLYMFQRSGDSFALIPSSSNSPAWTAHGVSFSPDGRHMAIAHSNDSRLSIYKRSINTLHGNLSVSGQGNVWGDLSVSSHVTAERITVSQGIVAASVTVGNASEAGTVVFRNTNNANTVTIATDSVSSSYKLTLPSSLGLAGQCLVDTTGTGVLGWVNCGVGGNADIATNDTLSTLGGGTHSTGGTLQGGAAKFQNASDSDKAFSVLNAAGSELLVADTTNMTITVTELIVSTNIVVNGHIVSGGSTPSIAALQVACTAPVISISGTDTAGTITVTTGVGCDPEGDGDLAAVTFAQAYGKSPRVTITAANASSARLQSYVDTASVTATGFSIGTAVAPTDSTTYTWNYHVIE